MRRSSQMGTKWERILYKHRHPSRDRRGTGQCAPALEGEAWQVGSADLFMSGVVPNLSRQPRQDLTETFAREAGDAGFDWSRVSRPGLLTS
jgi:hypothetical protein